MTAAGAEPQAPLLELRDVSAGYGPFRAIFDVSLEIPEGKVLALLGSNGAGKTTIARVASGLVRPTRARCSSKVCASTSSAPYRIARLGIIHAPEGRSVFASLTVEENLVLTFRREFGRRGASDALTRAYELFPRLGERRKQIAGTLSGGEQRMLSLARVLVHPPRLLIADELSLGLAPIIIDEVYRNLAGRAATRARRCCSSSSTSATRCRSRTRSRCSRRGRSRSAARPTSSATSRSGCCPPRAERCSPALGDGAPVSAASGRRTSRTAPRG